MSNSKPDFRALGGAINQLEELLDGQAAYGDQNKDDAALPLLEDVVEEAEWALIADDESGALSPAPIDNTQIETTMQRLTEQMEAELEALTGMLRESMMHEFRKELNAAMGLHSKSDTDMSNAADQSGSATNTVKR
ncbi:MAG: hypothetical protein WDZ86_01755 [Gammaproteobacteria bacterium]